jgi:hypothetical protein
VAGTVESTGVSKGSSNMKKAIQMALANLFAKTPRNSEQSLLLRLNYLSKRRLFSQSRGHGNIQLEVEYEEVFKKYQQLITEKQSRENEIAEIVAELEKESML